MSSKPAVCFPTFLFPTTPAYGDHLLLTATKSTLMELYLKIVVTVGSGWWFGMTKGRLWVLLANFFHIHLVLLRLRPKQLSLVRPLHRSWALERSSLKVTPKLSWLPLLTMIRAQFKFKI